MKAAGGSGEMFDAIAPRYDALNRVLSLGRDQSWRRRLARALEVDGGMRVLDVATGTGDVALLVARQAPDVEVIGVDPSRRMLELARRKAVVARVEGRVRFMIGDALELPFGDESFDGAAIAFGIRNVPDRRQALRELARVTRDGRRVAILELSEPRRGPLAIAARSYIHGLVPRIGAAISGAREYRYLQESIEAFPSPDAFVEMMASSGLEVLRIERLTFGVAWLYVATPARGGHRR